MVAEGADEPLMRKGRDDTVARIQKKAKKWLDSNQVFKKIGRALSRVDQLFKPKKQEMVKKKFVLLLSARDSLY